MPSILGFVFSVLGISLSLGISGDYADWEEALDDGARDAEVLALAEQADPADNWELVEAARALGYTANHEGVIMFDDPIVEIIDGRTYVTESVVILPDSE
ncbi:hypothetical protein [Nesterenkonia haasae]|uniref:hypothetical protein n=1 Tax=Nesterenkonia haasae TaxID=2587813 RepID=UPI0013920C8D|nr:hypothetical protein [Nesterenkonia haasae]NDK32434.1 hypothetical protein [Nesterenkonia haasae]